MAGQFILGNARTRFPQNGDYTIEISISENQKSGLFCFQNGEFSNFGEKSYPPTDAKNDNKREFLGFGQKVAFFLK